VSEHTRFVAPARLIALFTAASRVLGLVREMAYSFFFGIDPVFSSFRVAFMLPNLARRLFGEGAMASAFIPVFTEVLQTGGRDRARRLAGSAFTLLGSALVALTLLVIVGVGIGHLARPSLTLVLTMIMMPYMIFICLTGFAGGMLNSLDRYGAPAAAPILLNVVLIVVLVVAGYWSGLQGTQLLYLVAVSVVIAGVLQFGLQVVDLRRAGCPPRLNLQWRDPDLRRILLMMGPMIVGLSAAQVNVLADSLIALFLVPDGRGPAVLGYAHMLYHLPLGVFGVALATAIFPLLSSKAAQRDHAAVSAVLASGLRVTVFIALPAAVGLILLATPVVSLLYERRGGRFDATATDHVAFTLICYSVGLVSYCAQPILTRAFYALQDVRTPVRIGLVSVAINLVLSLLLVFPLAEGGIALATAISTTGQVVWLVASLRRHLPALGWHGIGASAARTCGACAAMGVVVWWIALASRLAQAGNLAKLAVAIPAGIVVFIAAARLLGCGELSELLSRREPRSDTPNA